MYTSMKITLLSSPDAEKEEFGSWKESVHADGPQRTGGVRI